MMFVCDVGCVLLNSSAIRALINFVNIYFKSTVSWGARSFILRLTFNGKNTQTHKESLEKNLTYSYTSVNKRKCLPKFFGKK